MDKRGQKELIKKIMKEDKKSGMYESDYEKIRNKLNLFNMVLDTVKLDSNYSDKNSILGIASDDLEEVKEILNRMERKDGKKNTGK